MSLFRGMFVILSLFVAMAICMASQCQYSNPLDIFMCSCLLLIFGGVWVECLVVLCVQSSSSFRKHK